MKILMKRGMALLLALILIVGFLPATAFTAGAATVDYKYSGNYIYNWGTREEVATFLSPKAEIFYEDISYSELAALSGAASEEDVPESALYAKLQEIMTDAHKTITSYDGTRDMFQYTDCEANGNVISSFYSGASVGPAWDSGETWNREHTWPNSKGDMAGDGENDLMMLRPAASNVNSSRGNKAYGENDGYYNPNGESDGEYDLRGDVARIILYVYVRWGCTNTGTDYNPDGIFGTDGVIESKELLFNWMEEDPVDTWEMGRNDSVESITGTRNIFVDYPELAFELFEEEVPANMITPSGMAAASSYTVTAQSGNAAQGTVSVSGNVITATPEEGYVASGYEIISGTATVTQNGNIFTVNPQSDCTIRINFAARTEVTVSFSGATGIGSQTVYAGESIELPEVTTAPDGYTFLGWMEAELTKDTTEKTSYHTGAYTPTASVTLYALYSYEDANAGTGSGDYVKVTETPSDWSGEYVIVYEAGSLIFNGSLDAFDAVNNYQSVTISNNTIAAAEADPYKFIIAAMDGGYSIQGASGKYIGHGSNANGLTTKDSELKNTISLNNGNADIVCAGGAYLRYNASSDQCRFRYFKSSTYTNQKAIALYKKEAAAGVLIYTGNPLDCDHANTAAIGEAVEATCTTTGMTAGEKCTACGKIMSAQLVIPKKEHSYEGVDTPPTCTAAGYTTYICSVCSDSYTADEVPVTDHSYVDGVCTACGATNTTIGLSGDYYFAAIRSSGNYFYMTNDLGTASTKRYQAEDSGLTELPAAITSSKNSNVFTLKLQSDGTYKICAKYIDGNNYLGWTSGNSGALVAEESALKLTVDALENGTYNIHFTASDAERYLALNSTSGTNYFAWYKSGQKQDLALIPVNDAGECQHDNTTVTGEKAATCTEDGYTGDTVCSDCGATVEYGDTVEATGHSYVGGTCENCGEAENSVVIPEFPETGNYELVTDINEVLTGGKFVIVAHYDSNNYAMSVATSGRPAATEVTVSNGTVAYVEGTTPVWTIGQYGDSVVLVNGEEYLGYSSSTTFTTSTEPYAWVVTAGDNNTFTLTAFTTVSESTVRAISYQGSGNQFGAYATSNTTGYCAALNFYKLTEGEVEVITSNISLKENGVDILNTEVSVGSTYTMPEPTNAAPEGYTFIGWVEENVDDSNIKPEIIYTADSSYTVGGDVTFYALYTRTEVIEDGVVYKPITDLSDLSIDEKIIIAASYQDKVYALSTTQNSNNRSGVEVTLDGEALNVNEQVAILTLAEGNIDGTFAFYCQTKGGYLAAAASGNNNRLYTQKLSDAASFEITLTDGVFSVVSQTASPRNTLKLNYNNGSPLFACYASGMIDVVLYGEMVGTSEVTYYTTLVCAHNWTEATCTAPKTCSVCGETDGEALGHTEETIPAVDATNDTHGWTEGTCCSVCEAVLAAPTKIPCLVGTMESWNITLRADIGVNFHLFVNESVREDAQISVTFYGKTETIAASQFPYDEEKDVYIVTVDAAAAQMMDDIVLQITDGTGNTVEMTRTIRQYADYILNSDLEEHIKYHPMVKEMLNYGAKAQEYFNYNNDNEENLANTGITDVGAQEVPESAAQEKEITGRTEGITFYGATLLFRNKIALRYYFEPVDIDTDYTFTVNGVAYTPKVKQGLLYIEIPGINPDQLDEQYQVVVGTGDDPLTVTYGPMNYLVNMSVKGSNTIKALVKALYNYHLAAEVLSPDEA